MIKGWQIVDYEDIAHLLGVQTKSLQVMRCQDKSSRIRSLPKPIRTIGNSPVWDYEDIARWWVKTRPILCDVEPSRDFGLYNVIVWFGGLYTLSPTEGDRVIKIDHADLMKQLHKHLGGYLVSGFQKQKRATR